MANSNKKPNFLKRIFSHNPNYDVQNKELFRFGLGVGGQCHCFNLVGGYFEYFCNMVLYITPLYTGILLWVMRGWDAINDPVAGMIIDKVEFKNGDKLRPYIRYLALPIGIFAALMFIDWGFRTEAARICYIAAFYFLWDTCYSFQDIAQWSMVSRISSIPERRDAAAFAGRLGCLAGALLPGLISSAAGLIIDGKLPLTLAQLFIICGIYFGFMGMCMSLFVLTCKERAPTKPPQGNLFAGFRLLKYNKIVILLTIATLLNASYPLMQATYFFQFMVNVSIFGYRVNGLTMMVIFSALTGLPGAIAMFFTPSFAHKVGGMRNILVIAAVTSVISRIGAAFVGFEGWRFWMLVLFSVILGIPNGMVSVATTSLWSDSVALTEWKTGQRNEGAVFSVSTFMAKMTSSISFLSSGITLTLLKFEPKTIQARIDADNAAGIVRDMREYVSPEFVKWSWWLYILAPAIGSLLYLIPVLCLHYSDKDKAFIASELASRQVAEEQISLDKSVEDIV